MMPAFFRSRILKNKNIIYRDKHKIHLCETQSCIHFRKQYSQYCNETDALKNIESTWGGSVGWSSNSESQLRSWSQGCDFKFCIGLHSQPGTYLKIKYIHTYIHTGGTKLSDNVNNFRLVHWDKRSSKHANKSNIIKKELNSKIWRRVNDHCLLVTINITILSDQDISQDTKGMCRCSQGPR